MIPSEQSDRRVSECVVGLLCNMRRIELGKNLDFLLDVLDLVLCTLEVYDLDRHRPLRPLFIPARPAQPEGSDHPVTRCKEVEIPFIDFTEGSLACVVTVGERRDGLADRRFNDADVPIRSWRTNSSSGSV
jgi:hypothetical protein